MQLFDVPQARHFCTPLTGPPSRCWPVVGFLLHNSLNPHLTRLSEGTQHFKAHRVSILNAVERWILFGISDYRRALDMLIPCNAPWAHVTLYYSSFLCCERDTRNVWRLGPPGKGH